MKQSDADDQVKCLSVQLTEYEADYIQDLILYLGTKEFSRLEFITTWTGSTSISHSIDEARRVRAYNKMADTVKELDVAIQDAINRRAFLLQTMANSSSY